MIHTCGAKFATYTRKSNRHNWELCLTAIDNLSLVRALFLDFKDFPEYQHAYLTLKGEYNTLDNLPKDYVGLQAVDNNKLETMIKSIMQLQ